MVVIRLARAGGKKSPFYHLVVADSRKSRGGRFIEQVGFYNPMARGPETRLELNRERITYWKNTGAQPSDRVTHILKIADTDSTINERAPTKAELKTAQIAQSIKAATKAAKEKAKAGAETAAEEKTEKAEKSEPENADKE